MASRLTRACSGLALAALVALAGCSESRSAAERPSPDASTLLNDDASLVDLDAPSDAAAMDSAVDAPPTGWPADGYELVGIDGCTREPIAEGFAFAPVLTCAWSSPQHERRVCSTGPSVECFRASDCDAKPFGHCEAVTSSQCAYPHTGSTCATDADCTELPDGVCFPAISNELFCDADGNNCQRQRATCHYRVLNQTCTSDVECAAAPGGACARAVWLTRCVYFGCEADSDCAAGEICNCHTCVTADCQSDADCGAGELCRQGNTCGWGPGGGFHCTTPDGDCRTDDDCSEGGFCDYDAEHARFFCSTAWCSVP